MSAAPSPFGATTGPRTGWAGDGEPVEAQPRGNGPAIASFGCGLLVLPLSFGLILFYYVAWPLGVAAVVLGVIGRRRVRRRAKR